MPRDSNSGTIHLVNTANLSRRAGLLSPSPTLGITAKANAMRAEGIDVVSFAAGEPDFPTPQPICDEAIAAIKAGFTKYTPTSGIMPLKEAIVEKLERENDVKVKPSQIVVSCGAKQSLYNSLMVLIDPGDEVLIFAPYWMTYAEQITLAGGVPVVVYTDAASGFVPTIEAIKEKITPKTRAMMINSPSNPTGAVYPRETIKEIAALAIKHDLWVLSDEIYERLVYGDPAISIASLGSEIASRTITIGGCSKSFAMTGWRIGFAAAPQAVASAMSNLQDQVTSNPNSFAQRGAVAAYHLDPASIETMRAEFQTRRDLIVGLLTAIPNVKMSAPGGAFYAFPDVRHYLGGRFKTDGELADFLLEEAQVATVPGFVFEGAGHIRLSYAASQNDIRRGVERIGNAFAKIDA